MKKIYFLIVLLCTSVSSVLAQRIESGGLYFELEEWNNMSAYVSQDASYSSMTEVTIPSTVEYNGQTYTVVRIGYNAFYECDALTTVTMPNTIKEIQGNAFQNCIALKTVNMSNALTHIGEYAFHQCKALESITIPNTVTHIQYDAFGDCISLKSINIPNSVQRIESMTFYGCRSLQSVILPNSMEYIGGNAFSSCYALTSINIPEGITKIENYTFQDCNSLESVTFPSTLTRIGQWSFQSCDSLSSLTIPNTVTFIGEYAFADCQRMQNLTISTSVKTVGERAFGNNYNLQQIDILASNYQEVCEGYLNKQLYYANDQTNGAKRRIFVGGTELKGDVVLPEGVTTIGEMAFYNCKTINSIELPSTITSIGDNSFNGISMIHINGTTPPTINNIYFIDEDAFVILPDTATLTIYKAAPIWSEFGTRLISKDAMQMREVTVVASNSVSSLHKTLGEENLINTISLKIHGTINSYDIMLIRNKMLNLRYLDLSDAEVRACPYEYYSGYCTHDNKLENYSFSELNLRVVHLPKNLEEINDCFTNCQKLDTVYCQPGLKRIGSNAFSGCSSLRYVGVYDGLTEIGDYAFHETCRLQTMNLPTSLERIGAYAFYNSGLNTVTISPNISDIGREAFRYCKMATLSFPANGKLHTISSEMFSNLSNLKSIDWEDSNITRIEYCGMAYCDSLKISAFPKRLKYIGDYAFQYCRSIDTINMPRHLDTIGYGAFQYCDNVKVIKIPSSVRQIQNQAFYGCNQVKRVYTYTIEPTSINQQTFSCYKTATLYVPKTSYYNYYYDTQWSQFIKLLEFDEEYDYFYLHGDYYLGGDYGVIKGDPDGDLFAGSGLIIVGNQTIDVHNLHYYAGINYYDWKMEYSSIITDNNLSIDTLFIHIPQRVGEWQFLTFPFDIDRSQIECNNEFVVRYYDGKTRADQGSGGWKNVPVGQKMYNGTGYIFQTAKDDTLNLVFPKAKLPYKDASIALQQYVSENSWDANWNLVGNPFLSYYDLDSIKGFTYPVVTWNGWGYDTYRPGDDEYHFKPLESFFIQNVDLANIVLPANGRETHTQATEKLYHAPARRNLAASAEDASRLIININLSDSAYSDRTRVVFNPLASIDYEMGVDANKFISTTAPVQLYTLGDSNEQYSINERPATMNGEVIRLGYYASYAGTFTLSASRMDTTIMLYDSVEKQYIDLAQGTYTFTTDKGFCDTRFTMYAIATDDTSSSIQDIHMQDLSNVSVYTITGLVIAENVDFSSLQLPAGVYMIQINNDIFKIILK